VADPLQRLLGRLLATGFAGFCGPGSSQLTLFLRAISPSALYHHKYESLPFPWCLLYRAKAANSRVEALLTAA